MPKKSSVLPRAPFHESEVIRRLADFPEAYSVFLSLSSNNQREFLDFCCGRTGLYLCYDTFFKKIFDPFLHAKRLEKFISALLGQDITIIDIIPNEGFRLSDRGSFVVADIVVRLADSSILNIEMQKNGYDFSGKRFDCYNADLIMREYNRLREVHGKSFTYRKMPPILSIALMETSPGEFHRFPSIYIHNLSMKSDTGIRLENLTRQLYVSLDIFHAFMQNKPIETPLEAWLMLLTTRDLCRIEELICKFPDFSDIYKEVFELRTRPEELIHMYSNVFLEADRNTERFMVDELKKKVAMKDAEISEKNAALSEKDTLIAELQKKLADANLL
ncbi:MAG: PD-(D/E)XK nuclease family transposase [Roseburia sp.]|nr:PD-(D/E)XK nuclease family transposase [Roseburia sp.]